MPSLNTEANVRGVVSDSRMTPMGPAWRPVPVVRLHGLPKTPTLYGSRHNGPQIQ